MQQLYALLSFVLADIEPIHAKGCRGIDWPENFILLATLQKFFSKKITACCVCVKKIVYLRKPIFGAGLYGGCYPRQAALIVKLSWMLC